MSQKKIAYTPIQLCRSTARVLKQASKTDISETYDIRWVIVMIKIPITQFTNCILIVSNLLNFNSRIFEPTCKVEIVLGSNIMLKALISVS